MSNLRTNMVQKAKDRQHDLEKQVTELTADLQRVQADFVNYRRRVDEERQQLINTTKAATIMKLLPVVDDIERALSHMPDDLSGNTWAKGVTSLLKSVEKSLQDLGITRIEAKGEIFNPALHEAISADDGDGELEIVTDELRAGYKLDGQVIRPSLVKVAHQQLPADEQK